MGLISVLLFYLDIFIFFFFFFFWNQKVGYVLRSSICGHKGNRAEVTGVRPVLDVFTQRQDAREADVASRRSVLLRSVTWRRLFVLSLPANKKRQVKQQTRDMPRHIDATVASGWGWGWCTGS